MSLETLTDDDDDSCCGCLSLRFTVDPLTLFH